MFCLTLFFVLYALISLPWLLVFFKTQEKKLKLEEKRKKLAAVASLLEGRNADGLVSGFAGLLLLSN